MESEPESASVPLPPSTTTTTSSLPSPLHTSVSLDALVSMMSAGEQKHNNKSQLERTCAAWMQRCKLPFQEQKRFVDCKNKNSLPFDFAVEPANALIELDGSQHFVPTSFGKSGKADQATKDHNLHEQQFKDQIKTNFTRSCGIHFLRISFSEMPRLTTHLEHFFRTIERVGVRGERIEMFCGKEYHQPRTPILVV